MSAPSTDQATIRLVDVDGLRLRASVRGSGPPLLIITGLGASLDLAEPFERELTARGVQAISFDAPGVGQSTAYRRPRRIPGVARTVDRMLQALGYDQVDVLGISLGGVVAQQLAWQAPHRARSRRRARVTAGAAGAGDAAALLPARLVRGAPTAARRAATRTRCCTARSRGSSSGPRSAATSASSTRSAGGPACRG